MYQLRLGVIASKFLIALAQLTQFKICDIRRRLKLIQQGLLLN